MDETSTTPRLSLTTLSGDRGEEEKVDEIDAFKGSPELKRTSANDIGAARRTDRPHREICPTGNRTCIF